MHRMRYVLWLRRLFNCLILCLLICNLTHLTTKYVKYETDTNVAPYFPVRLNVTKLSLCFSIGSLLDRSPHGYSFSSDQSIKYINWTFDKMFRKMPSASSTLDSCKYRDFDLDILREEKDGRKCAELFKVIRYRMQGYMCYRYTFPLDQEYSFHLLVNSLYSPRELYHLSIAQPLSDQQVVYALLHLDDFPDDDRVFNTETYRESASLFQFSYNLYESYSLPSPYETHCALESKITSYQKCLADFQGKLGFSHDGDLTMENSSAASLQLRPLETRVHLNHYRSSCYTKCPHEACTQVLVNTGISKINSRNKGLLVTVETINRFITKIQYLPKFSLIDCITQVGSVVSIWTGIAVITLSKLIQPRQSVALKTIYSAVKWHLMTVRAVLSRQRRIRIRKDALLVENERLKTRLKRRSILAIAFKVSLLPFFVWQLFNVIHHYFLFATTARFNYYLNPKITIPTLGFCFEYRDLANVRSAEPTEDNYHRLFLASESKFNLTLKQLLQDASEDVIDGCFIRYWKSRFKWFKFSNASSCLNYFSVKKFYSSQKLCYQVFPSKKLEAVYYQSDMKILLTNPSIVYSIILGSKFVVPRRMHIFTQFGDDLPRSSVEFSVEVHKRDMSNMISFSNRLYRLKMLPAPYDTSCDPKLGRSKCLDVCISQSLSRYNRISYGSTEGRKLDMRFLSYSDLLNDSVNEMWRQTEIFCDKKCWRFFCDYSFTTTTLEGEIPVKNMRNILAVDFPSQPTVEMKAIPVMTLYKFMYEIICCFSFWLGFSFIELKPASASMERKMKIKVYLTKMYLVVDKVLDRLLRIGLWSSYVQSVQGLSSKKLVGICFRYSMMSLCFCHITHSMMIYMSYSAFIDVYELIETKTNFNLFICLDTAELIERKFPSRIKDPIVARSVVFNRTVTSLFADTPREDEVIQECGYWGLYSRRANLSQLGHVSDRIFFSTKNKSICDQIYEVQKVLIQSYMCYSIWPRYYTGWSRHQMRHALDQRKTFLKVSIRPSLLTKQFTLLVDSGKFIPFTSSTFGHNIFRDPKHNRYDVSYIRYIQSSLPSPKSTDGFVPFLFDRCLNQCVNKKFAPFNLTLSQRFRDSSSLRFVSFFHRKNGIFTRLVRRIQEQCEAGCVEHNKYIKKDNHGNIELLVPIIEARREKELQNSPLATISLKSTNHPVLSIIFKLKVSFFQQIINLGSILGLWFGFSAVTLARMGRLKDKEIGLQELLAQKQRIRVLTSGQNTTSDE